MNLHMPMLMLQPLFDFGHVLVQTKAALLVLIAPLMVNVSEGS